MLLKTLKLRNFRNYENETFSYADGINIVVGANAQGKTNSAEAAFLLATGFSPRVKKDKQVVRHGEKEAEISACASSKYGDLTSSILYSSDGKKKIIVNGAETKKIGELLGNINAVFFNPGELKLVQESPDDRRRFMDVALSQLEKMYFYSLSKYKKIIIQRNNLLKHPDREMVLDTLPVWDEQLAEYAADVILGRNVFLKKLSPLAKAAHSYITDQKEELCVTADEKFGTEREEIKDNFLSALSSSVEKDLILGYTTTGPHRDDIKITLAGEDVKSYCSQGQQRTAALALKLAELEIFRERFGEYPVLILDDAMSELDRYRQRRLLSYVENMQTIITCTHVEEEVFSGAHCRIFEVDNGKITSVVDR